MIARPILSTIEVNAIGAALNERIVRLETELVRLEEQPETPSRDEAIDYVTMAVRHAIHAQHVIEDACTAEDDPLDEVSVAVWAESELRAAYGDR